ncbi:MULTISPECIES: Tn3 family transposase [unclassified Parafrankia]|uniref:Tn3 family transposase n=1 Tax=unclassified Parafrankia TaxID=2994368 RepID=UPI000DA521CD|nr:MULTISPECIES: Tn3 family transposase [unclassified Parafrankia]TCJ35038.1 Tn3 family transposase [Parafrankia sp. BMG5.11]SQD97346.1 hypothetical protein FMEAI12_4020075 [Parafrankia sp. Ea1.12]
MPVEFLTDDEAAAYGRYAGAPSRVDLERVFFLDDEDRALVERHRGGHMRLGFSLQLVTVRWVGTFLEDPLDVPVPVLDFMAEQLGVADPSCVKRYTERTKTRFDHQWEIRRECGLKEFTAAEEELRAWVAARSWTSGDGPKATFTDAVEWLRKRDVLLPGLTTLARLVAQVRDDTTRRLWGVLEGLLTVGQRYVLDQLLEVPPGSRVSDLERWRKGPAPRGSGPAMAWEPSLAEAFTAVSGGRSRLEDLPTSIAACLTAHSMNVGYRPIARKGFPALERSRLSHVFQNYFRPETLAPANAPLVTRQAGLPLARAWGGGMVAAVDGMRFVVPVPAAFARPNRKFFGSKRGMTWLNAMNDQGIGRGAKIVSGTVRDSLHMIDVIFGLDGGELPEIVVTDTGSYSDVIFGLLELLGISYRPALADLPDQKGWRISADADYGPLNTFARGKIDLGKIRRNWEDILRVVASIYTGTVRAYDVVTMLQRDGHPTALGEAIAAYGRIFKSLHILAYIDTDETYRRDIKHIRNLQEGRHALARKICHGRKGELYHRYERGLENQLGVLGLVLNCVVLWTTVYLDAAVRLLKAQGYPVREEDTARLSPFVNRHLGVHGTYNFVLPDLAPGTIRELRDPDAPDDDEGDA